MTKKQRNKIYKTTLNGVENNKKYTENGLCHALKTACYKHKLSSNTYDKINPYDLYKSGLIEYSLFFNNECIVYLDVNWTVKKIILDLCIAMSK